MKRILMIIQNFPPSIGGAEKQALELSKGLVQRGYTVSVLTRRVLGAACNEVIEGVTVIRLPVFGPLFLNSLIFLFFSAFYLVRYMSEFDIYHVHLASSHAMIPSILGRIIGKKVIIKLSGGKDIGELAQSRKSLIGKLKLKITAWGKPHLVMVNRDQENEIIMSGLGHLSRTLIPNGVNLKSFFPVSPLEKQEIRKKLGWAGKIFLFVGRFSEDKLRLDVFQNLLMGWKAAFPENAERFFYLVGAGPLEEKYKSLIKEHGLEKTFQIIGPQVNIAQFYQAADVFVLPSISEGMSNALLEAMACGLPVIASKVSGIVNIIEDGKQGLLFDPLAPQSIASAFSRSDKGGLVQDNQPATSKYALEVSLNKYETLFSSDTC